MAIDVRDDRARATPLTSRMAEALHALGPADLPAPAAAKAKLCLLDFLACALSARELPWGREAIALATLDAANGDETSARAGAGLGNGAPVIGTPYLVSTADASFANAVLGHGLVRDDMHLGSISHLGVVVLPPLLALLESRPVSGPALLAAIAAGYEAGGKLGRMILDVEVARIFRPTGITGPFAAAAASAKLLGLGAAEYANALAIAANAAAGYNEWAVTGGSEMFFHPGFAARNGLTATRLAAAGANASASALDGERGLLAAFGKNAAPAVPAPFADRFEILDVFFKEVPACNFAQTAAQVARDIAGRGPLEAGSIARVRVRVPFAAANYPGCDCPGPFEQILQAKMSIQYNVAAALCRGDFAEANYDPGTQPQIVRLAARTEVEVDPALTAAFPARQAAGIGVVLEDGRELLAEAPDVRPATEALVRERFAHAAAATFGAARARELADFVGSIEAAADLRDLGRLLRASVSATFNRPSKGDVSHER